ncbi:transposase [Nitrosomonas sp. Is37]|uniref:transposase n=1 Tax=Nitrosomonas sp. Is37 TaxID=3080535 RepID=UPI00294B3FE7|nr:transposase [Nitrosomonas sp. Is37]MDV6345119.1 transposase [Nitrosomonas sp. Is37]
MARPIRLEFSNGLYHVMSRGNGGEAIFAEDEDRQQFLDLLAELITRYQAICYAYCLMDNHYHLLLETPKANLSQIMRGLNGRYTRFFNKTRQRMGHVFQGRYKAIIVQKDNYLLELSRYIIFNPVRAGIIDVPENYSWSSYSATIGQYACPDWLAADNLLSLFDNRRKEAIRLYKVYVSQGVDQPFSGKVLQQTYLGDNAFIGEVQKHISLQQSNSIHITKRSKKSPKKSMDEIAAGITDRGEAMNAIYKTGHYTMFEIAAYFNVHYSTVSRSIRSFCKMQ